MLERISNETRAEFSFECLGTFTLADSPA